MKKIKCCRPKRQSSSLSSYRSQQINEDPEDFLEEPFNRSFSCKSCTECSPEVKPVKTTKMVIFVPSIILLTGLFLMWSLYNIYITLCDGSSTTLLYGIIFCALGSGLGRKDACTWRFHRNFAKELITIPRSYSTPVVILLCLILKAFWSYFYFTCIDIPDWMYLIDTITSSMATGFFGGRTVYFFKRYLQP